MVRLKGKSRSKEKLPSTAESIAAPSVEEMISIIAEFKSKKGQCAKFVEELVRTNASLESRLKDLQKKSHNSTEYVNSLREANSSLESQLREIRLKNDQITTYAENITREKKAIEQQLVSNNPSQEGLIAKDQYDELLVINEKLNGELSQLRNSSSEMESRFNEYYEINLQNAHTIEELTKANQDLSAKFAEAVLSKSTLESEALSTKEHNRILELEMMEIRIQMKADFLELKQLREERGSLEAECNSLRATNSQRERDFQMLLKVKDSLQQSNASSQPSSYNLSSMPNSEIETLAKEILQLEQKLEDYEKEIDGLVEKNSYLGSAFSIYKSQIENFKGTLPWKLAEFSKRLRSKILSSNNISTK